MTLATRGRLALSAQISQLTSHQRSAPGSKSGSPPLRSQEGRVAPAGSRLPPACPHHPPGWAHIYSACMASLSISDLRHLCPAPGASGAPPLHNPPLRDPAAPAHSPVSCEARLRLPAHSASSAIQPLHASEHSTSVTAHTEHTGWHFGWPPCPD
ncbi:hypothetical protein NDU88_000401 [Pleurodeles waltl]|uniref:Uncharacterized protein n=1 Tax=Pleurodeles waltl TaxID=8319 RepID=A0AAV7V6T3_PLEWA|nr:hypothetical protein NDU88_000401 [Pleurodeles waltl]